MSTLAQHLLNGLMQGTIYGIVAMGFTILFGVMNVIKFSHGDVLALGAFGSLSAVLSLQSLGLPPALQLLAAFAAAILLSGATGAVIARTLIMPLREAPPLNMLLMTMMIGTVLREAIRLFYPGGTNPQRYPELLPHGGFSVADVYVRYDGLILVFAGIASIGLVHWVITRTRLGLAIRAVAEDSEVAQTMGIDFAKIIPVTFALGSLTAGFAGVLFGLYYSEINYGMGLLLAIIGFSAAIVGGLGNIWGAILGGYFFAGLQTLVVAAIPSLSDYKNVVAFIAVIMLMTWRPTGLLGEGESARV